MTPAKMTTMKHKRNIFSCILIVIATVSNIIIVRGGNTQDQDVNRCLCIIYITTGMADCSHANLKTVPGIDCIPVDTKILLLNNNKINEMKPNMFLTFPHLEDLYLEGNEIQHIHDETFKGLSKLTTLSLYNNQLRLNDSYSPLAFKPLVSLRNLKIQKNCEKNQCYYPNEAISYVPSLKTLTLDGAYSVALGEGFGALTNLESLVFDGDTGFCFIDKMPLDMFQHIRQTPVSNISLLNCKINQLLPMTFANIRHLTNLTSIYNRLFCAEGIYNVTIGLNSTNIRFLHLTHSCNSFPMNLPKYMFVGIRETKLEVLDLSSDRIQIIDPDCMDDLPMSLKSISLRDNVLFDIHFLINMVRLVNLVSFDMSYQSIIEVSLHKRYNNRLKISNVELDGNISKSLMKMNDVDSIYAQYKHKKYMSMYSNTSPSLFELINDDSPIYLPPKLKFVYMSNLKLGLSVISLTFDSNNSMEYLDVSSNLLRKFLGPLKGLNGLTFLNLSNNKFQHFQEEWFGYLANLTTLLLDYNKLGKTIGGSENMLLNLTKLEVLELSNNAIKDLPLYFFRNQVKLKWLSLADNALISISFVMDGLCNLEHLDLSNNQIQFLSEQNIWQLDGIASGRKLVINMIQNNLMCKCEHKNFIIWFSQTNINFTNKSEMTCTYLNGTAVSLGDAEAIATALRDECYAWLVVTACVVTFSVLLLLSSLVAKLYDKRWQLRYLYHANRRRINPYHLLENEEIVQTNDVYISYTDYGDFKVSANLTLDEYVKTKLYPKLLKRGIRVKIREELQAGRKLADVIADEIRNSRKLLVLLNSSYCKDFWCHHEFNFALNEGIYTKRQVVIPVIVGDVSDADVDPDILKVLRSDPVSRYPGYEQDDAFVDFVEFKIGL